MRTRGVEAVEEEATTSVEVEDESLDAAAMKRGNPCDAVRAVLLSCFLSCESRHQLTSRKRTRMGITYNLASSLLVRHLEPLHIQQIDVEFNKLLQRRPALLVLHPLRQLPHCDLIDEPLELLLRILDTSLPPVLLPLTLKYLRFDPEGKDLAPDVEIGPWSRGGRDFRDFSGEEFDGGGELEFLRELERGNRGEGLGEEGEELGVRVEGDEHFFPMLSMAISSVTARLVSRGSRREILPLTWSL